MISFNEWKKCKNINEAQGGQAFVPGVSDKINQLMGSIKDTPNVVQRKTALPQNPQKPSTLANFKSFINKTLAPRRAFALLKEKIPDLNKKLFDTILNHMKGNVPDSINPPYSLLGQMKMEDWTDPKRLASHWLRYKQEIDWTPERIPDPVGKRIEEIKSFIGDLATHKRATDRKDLLNAAGTDLRQKIVNMTKDDWDDLERQFQFLPPKDKFNMLHALRWLHMNMRSLGIKYNRSNRNLSQLRKDLSQLRKDLSQNPPIE